MTRKNIMDFIYVNVNKLVFFFQVIMKIVKLLYDMKIIF